MAPFAKTLPLIAVKLKDSLVTAPGAWIASLVAHWASTIQQVILVDLEAEELIIANDVDLQICTQPPSYAAYLRLLERLDDTSVGPDGVPYSGWLRAPPSVNQFLHHLYTHWKNFKKMD